MKKFTAAALVAAFIGYVALIVKGVRAELDRQPMQD